MTADIFKNLSDFDERFREANQNRILGIDEAGRGCLAGPLVVAGVVYRTAPPPFRVNDSKQLTANQRERAFLHIRRHALFSIYKIVSVGTVDRMNIYQATLFAAKCIAQKAARHYDRILTDSLKIDIHDKRVDVIKKGDTLSLTVASASVIAKVIRDRLMARYDRLFPEYGFKSNKGYGTLFHRQVIIENGILPIHRRTYNPVKGLLANGQCKFHPGPFRKTRLNIQSA